MTTSVYMQEVLYIVVVVGVFFSWSVAAELEQLGAPSRVVFPDKVALFAWLFVFFFKNKPQFWQMIHITIPQLMAVANPAYIQIA